MNLSQNRDIVQNVADKHLFQGKLSHNSEIPHPKKQQSWAISWWISILWNINYKFGTQNSSIQYKFDVQNRTCSQLKVCMHIRTIVHQKKHDTLSVKSHRLGLFLQQ